MWARVLCFLLLVQYVLLRVFSQIVWPSFIETSSRVLWIVKLHPTYCASIYVTTFFSAAIAYNVAHVESLLNSLAFRRHAVTLCWRGDHVIYNYIRCGRSPSAVWDPSKTKYFIINQKQNGSFAVRRLKGARIKNWKWRRYASLCRQTNSSWLDVPGWGLKTPITTGTVSGCNRRHVWHKWPGLVVLLWLPLDASSGGFLWFPCRESPGELSKRIWLARGCHQKTAWQVRFIQVEQFHKAITQGEREARGTESKSTRHYHMLGV